MSTERSESVFPRMVELRRAIHRHPELAFEEVETAKVIMGELERLGIPYEYGGKGGADDEKREKEAPLRNAGRLDRKQLVV